MMDSLMQKCLSFDDVLLVPRKSDIESRQEIAIGSSLGAQTYITPIISSPMDTVTETNMVVAMHRLGGLGIIHRYNSVEHQVNLARDALQETNDNGSSTRIACAIGISGDFQDRSTALFDAGVKVLCVDVAHGHHVLMERALKTLRDVFGNEITIIAGNVATPDGFTDLEEWGADAIRVGIGGGSICSTRLQTGHGISTLQSVFASRFVRKRAKIIADGGIRTSGDIVKSIAAGADFVILGSMLAGTSESPGSVLRRANGDRYKVYRGMASREAQINWRGEARSLEGVSTTVPYRGPVKNIITDLTRNIRSGFSYSGAKNQEELKEKARFIQQTSASQIESQTRVF